MGYKNGIKIKFMSREKLRDKKFDEKLNIILDHVKEHGIVVLEEGLTPDEKTKLIEASLNNINENFPGIEFSGFNSENWLDRFLKSFGIERKQGFVIVGSSKVMEKLTEDSGSAEILAKLR